MRVAFCRLTFFIALISCFLYTLRSQGQEIKNPADKYYYNNFDGGQLGSALTQIGGTASLGITGPSTANLTTASGYSLRSLGNSTAGGYSLDMINTGTNLNDEIYGYEWTFLYKNTGGNPSNSDIVENGENSWKYWFYKENSTLDAAKGYFITQEGSNIVIRYRYSNDPLYPNQYNTLVSYDLTSLGGNNKTYAIRVQRVKRLGAFVWHLFIDEYTPGIDQAKTERGSLTESTLNVYGNSALLSSSTTNGRFLFDEMKMYSMKLEITGANETANGISNPLYQGQIAAIIYGLEIKARGFFDIYQIVFGLSGNITSIVNASTVKLMRSTDNFFGSADDSFLTNLDTYDYASQKYGFYDNYISTGNNDGSSKTVGYYYIQTDVRADASLVNSFTFTGTPTLYSYSLEFNYVAGGSVTNTVAPPSSSGTLYDWQGTTSTAWSTPTNWSPNGTPGENDIARIGIITYGSNHPTVTTTTTVGNVIFGTAKAPTLTVNSGVTLNIVSSLTQQNLPNANFQSVLNGAGTISMENMIVGNRTFGTGSGTQSTTISVSINNVNISGALIFNSVYSATRSNNAGLQITSGKIVTTKEIRSLNSDVSNVSGVYISGGTLRLTGATPLSDLSSVGKTYIVTPTASSSTVEYAGNNAQIFYPAAAYITDNPLIGTPENSYSSIKFSGNGTKTALSGTMNVKAGWDSAGGKIDLLTNATIVDFKGTTQSLTDGGSDGGEGVFFKNLNFSGGGTKTLAGTGKFSVASGGFLTVAASTTLAASGKLFLKSDILGFANVSPLSTGVISGNVNVETFFAGGVGKRGTRLVSPSINDNLTPSGNKVYQQLKNSMVITGPGGAANGFDPGNGQAPFAVTLTTYNEPALISQPQFTSISNLNNGTVPLALPGKGFYLFYRGDRSNYTPATAATSTKLETAYIPESFAPVLVGTLNQGIVTTSITNTNNLNDANNGYNMVGNPYAATIDWEKVYATNAANVANEIRIIQPGGAIMSRKNVGGNVTVINAGHTLTTQYIQPGQGFYIRKTSIGTANLTFNEAHKSVAAVPDRLLFSPPGNNLLSGLQMGTSPVRFMGVQPNGAATTFYISLTNGTNEDETAIVFKDGFDPGFDVNDAIYIQGSPVILASQSAANGSYPMGISNAINYMPDLGNVPEIKLNVNASVSGSLTLNFKSIASLGIYKASLLDKYTNQQIDLDLNSVYNFNVDRTIAATYGTERFVVKFVAGPPLTINLSKFEAVRQENTVKLNWTTAAEKSSQRFEVEHSINSVDFLKLGEISGAGTSSVQNNYSFIHEAPNEGINYYRLKQIYSDGTFSYSASKSLNFITPSYLDLASFDVKQENTKLKLDWITLTERNSIKFEIERSSNNNSYLKIGEVPGGGTTTTERAYSFNDNSPLTGVNIFRLKQIYADGTFNYSQIRNVTFTKPLAIDLADFKISKADSTVLIDWSTATEERSLRIEIERSENGSSFNKIGERTGGGNSTTAIKYNFTDTNPIVGVNYYRLKQIYDDGSFSYSQVQTLDNYKPYKINLSSFSVRKDGKAVILEWATSKEENTLSIDIEKSSDGITYLKLGQKAGAGNSSAEIQYIFTDSNPIIGVNYYRLKQSYSDGTFSYSQVKTLSYYKPFEINLSAFSARKEGTTVILDWSTEREESTLSIDVEKSSDGVTYAKLGQKPGAGNSSVETKYSLVDLNPIVGTNYYRLKQLYSDGTYSFSYVKIINYTKPLKINLGSFHIDQIGDALVLKWITLTEESSLRFDIERSSDGNSFIKIGEAAGAGNAVTSNSYTFGDPSPFQGENFYRLKHIYTDNTFSYSEIKVASFSKPLQLALLDFEVAKNNITADLQWKTQIEENTLKFEIQRAGDGSNFITIGETPAAGNSNNVKNYFFKDLKPVNGNNFYRLKLSNMKGDIIYSYIRTANFSNLVSYGMSNLSVYPNPATDFIEINMEPIGTKVTIYNLAGKPVKVTTYAAGEPIRQRVSDLSVGLYFIEVKSLKENKMLGTAKFFKN